MIKEITKKSFGIEWNSKKKSIQYYKSCNLPLEINYRKCHLCHNRGFI